ncbi:MAG: extracellular solute-binding protein [Eubacteriales bacterium]|nr:extracellular solute-binding protein [Eubacteriales bacterium]
MEKKLKILAVKDPAVLGYVPLQAEMEKAIGMPVQFDIVPWAEYYPTMLQIFSGQADYDIFMVAGHLWLCDFAEKGYLHELSYDLKPLVTSVAEEMKYRDKIYLSPSFYDGHLVVYRKSLLGKELPDKISPQEYIRLAKEMAKQGRPIAMKAHASEILTDALPFLRMEGAKIYDQNGKYCWYGDEAEKGLAEYCHLRQYAIVGTETYGNEEVANAIHRKEVPLAITWSGQMGVVVGKDCLEPEDLGFSALETGWNVTWSFAISVCSSNKEAAEKLLEYLRTPKVDEIVANYSGTPIREQTYEIGEKQQAWYAAQRKMMEVARAFPPVEKSGEKNGILYEEIYKAFIGQISPQTAIERAKSRIEAI